MIKAESLEIYRKHLFEKTDDKLPAQQEKRLIRLRGAFVHWTEFPMHTEVQVRDFLMETYDIKKTQAYEELSLVKMLLGNVKNAGKEWHRYRLIAMIEESYDLAKTKKDPKAMAMLIDKYGKYTQLHIPDQEQIPWDQLLPQLIEPTEDPTVIGLERDPDVRAKAKKLLDKYSNDITGTIKAVHVEDAEFVDLSEDGEK